MRSFEQDPNTPKTPRKKGLRKNEAPSSPKLDSFLAKPAPAEPAVFKNELLLAAGAEPAGLVS